MPDFTAWPFPHDDPFAAYAEARARAPVRYDPEVDGHIVLSFEHCQAILKDPETFSSDPRNNEKWSRKLDTSADIWAKTLVFQDPPVHTQMRKAMNGFFTPRAIQRIRDRVLSTVETALEPLADGEPVDIVNDIAAPISLGVICEMFDVGTEGAQILLEEAPRLITILEPDPNEDSREAVNAAAMTVMMYLVPLITERRRHPGDDIISALVHCDDPVLDADDIVMLCISTLPAGFITTTGFIGLGMVALLDNPDQFRWLGANPDKAVQATEELMRFDGPVQIAMRVATKDVTIGDHEIKAGEHIVVGLSAANRDPARFEEPERLDLTASRPPHLAFGHGAHYCLGHALGRMEGAETFKRLGGWADRLLAEEWTYRHDGWITFRGLDYLTQAGQPVGAGSGPAATAP
jgi:cytochrome P450